MRRVVAFAIAFAGCACCASPARADFGDPTRAREVRDALLRTWTAFGRDPAIIERAVSVPDVTLSGDYALCTFRAGAEGGQMLFQSQRGLWVKLFQTGGIMSSVDLRGLVPEPTAGDLATHNAVTRANDAFLIGQR